MGEVVQQSSRELPPETAKESGGESVTSAAILRLLKETEYRCAVSGVELTVETASVDHVIPIAKGGSHTMENIQIVHSTVNAMKGTLSGPEFLEWCKRIAAKS